MNKGDIVLIPFPFTDLTGIKKRPALILASTESDVTVCFITTRIKWQSEFDIKIEPSESNGIKKSSLIRLSKLATIDRDLIIGLIGQLDRAYFSQLDKKLIKLLQIET